ncbi:MAG: hypothetical protein ACPGRX_03805, partial [Bdellovibrionales bacterium]
DAIGRVRLMIPTPFLSNAKKLKALDAELKKYVGHVEDIPWEEAREIRSAEDLSRAMQRRTRFELEIIEPAEMIEGMGYARIKSPFDDLQIKLLARELRNSFSDSVSFFPANNSLVIGLGYGATNEDWDAISFWHGNHTALTEELMNLRAA